MFSLDGLAFNNGLLAREVDPQARCHPLNLPNVRDLVCPNLDCNKNTHCHVRSHAKTVTKHTSSARTFPFTGTRCSERIRIHLQVTVAFFFLMLTSYLFLLVGNMKLHLCTLHVSRSLIWSQHYRRMSLTNSLRVDSPDDTNEIHQLRYVRIQSCGAFFSLHL
jgi:hypothetical protein